MHRLILAASVILATLFTGCATVPLAPSSRDALAKTFTAPRQDGRVYCYRPYTYVGCAVTLPLECNEQHMADLAPDTFAYFDLHPGTHTFSTYGPISSRTSTKINVQPGKLYFLRQSMRAAGYTFPVRLIKIHEALAKKQLERCRLVDALAQPIENQFVEAGELAHGTGFAISNQGHILTAYHVVEHGNRIRVRFGNDEWLDATLLRHSRSFDVALLRVATNSTSYLPLTSAKSIAQGQKVFTIGYPAPSILGAESKYTEGVISSTTGVKGEASLLQVTVPIQPGNSGGALVASDGSVVGLVTSTAAVGYFFGITGTLPQNINWAVNAAYLRAFLGEVEGIPQAGAVSESPRTADEIITLVRKATCVVESRGQNVE